ncbi:Protein CYPRO4 [Capsicum baccatum]|uniref:Protein CYPRO4 n=1 Tax=Capsicum baccatum TaxID=33114 RepID=A0A2G2X1T7_CAPBA|nr:Protein CYPRO4 [Capsicum baccatum]
MDQKLPVDAITTETTDWNCKVQLVDKFRPRKSSDLSVHFQTVLVQDESEQQVSIVLYGDDIPKYENLFGLFETYLVSCAKVREPRSYSIRAGTYEWVADRYTIVEAVTNNNRLEAPLHALTKLDTLSFSAIEQQRSGVEFDLLTVVVNCSAIQYSTDQSNHFREEIVIDQSKKPFLFTIWGDLANNEGAALLHHLHEYPVILARRIGVTEFHGALRLATRYQTTILTNPQYVQASTLTNWVKHNQKMLLSYTLKSSSSSLNHARIEDQVLAISTIPELLSTVQSFPVEARLSLPDHPQSFYLLACSNCSQFVHPKTKKMVRCFSWLGSHITHVDVTYDGKWILGTTDTLILICTLFVDKNKSTKTDFAGRMGDKISAPRLLNLNPLDSHMAGANKFRSAQFS